MFNKAQLITEGENMISSCTDFSVFFYCWWIFRFWQVIQYFLQSSWSLLIEWISSTSGYLTVRLLLRFTAPNFNRSLYDSLLEPASRGHRRCFLHNSMVWRVRGSFVFHSLVLETSKVYSPAFYVHFQLHFGTVITTACSISATVGLLSSNFQIIYINVKKKMKYRTDEWHSLKKRSTGAELFEEPQTGC